MKWRGELGEQDSFGTVAATGQLAPSTVLPNYFAVASEGLEDRRDAAP